MTVSISKFFIPNFVRVLTNKRKYILNRIFIPLLGSCPRGGTWGVWGVKNFSMGICGGAPSTAHSSSEVVSRGLFNLGK